MYIISTVHDLVNFQADKLWLFLYACVMKN